MTRLEQLRNYMEKEGLDGFYIAKPANVRCISGWTGADSYLLITRNKQFFVTDPRYTEQAAMECPDYEIVDWRTYYGYDLGGAVGETANKNELKAVAFEADYLSYANWNSMQEKMNAQMVPTVNVIELLRAVKTKEEIYNLRVSCDIASRAFERILGDIRVGITEKELAAKLSYYMVVEGADTQPYGNIIISGPKTSLLHGIPGNRALEYGDFVLMDYGCQYKGYMSDMTRTVVVGKASDKQKEVYNLCRHMTEDTEKMIKAGVSGIDCYQASLEAIKDTEYLPYHYKGIGHGIGLFVHELPNIGATCPNILMENAVMTVEPGIYIPGWGGVRIEDQGLITKDGYENMISATHELIEL